MLPTVVPAVVIAMIAVMAIAVSVARIVITPSVVASAMMMIAVIVVLLRFVRRAWRIWNIRRAGSFLRSSRRLGAWRFRRAGYAGRIGLCRSRIVCRNAAWRYAVGPIFHRRRQTAVAAKTHSSRKLLIPGQKRQSSLVAERLENVAVDAAGIAYLTIAFSDNAVALLLQLPAATRAAKLRGAIQKNDRRRAVSPNIKIKYRPAHPDRSGGRHDLIR